MKLFTYESFCIVPENMKTLFTLLVIRCLLGMLSFAPPRWADSSHLTSEQKQKIIEYINSYLSETNQNINIPDQQSSLGSLSRNSKAVSGDLTPEQQRKILQYHNYYRSNTIPPAANMRYLVWNEKLARSAELWAEKCTYQLPIPRGFDMGNYFFATYNKPEDHVISWYNKREHYAFANNSCKFGEDCASYKTMMNAALLSVGCAQKLCGQIYLLSCRYDFTPSETHDIYETGTPCSMCPDTGSKCYMKLCIPPNVCESMPILCAEAFPAWN